MDRKFKNVLLPLLSGLILTALLWLAPERHAMWLWGWAAILVFPQPRLLVMLHALLATTCAWRISQHLGVEQTLLIAVMLASLMLLGMALQLDLRTQWQSVARRARLSHDTRLWPGHRLLHDLPLETTRCEREGSHGELVLLRCPASHQQALILALSEETRRFERCYQIDTKTLAALLIHRNASEAHLRHARLLEKLPMPRQLRIITLDIALAQPLQLSALFDQEQAVSVTEEDF